MYPSMRRGVYPQTPHGIRAINAHTYPSLHKILDPLLALIVIVVEMVKS